MNWIIGKITGNPMVLAYVAAACFAAGIAAGSIPAWKYQGALKDTVQANYDSFVGQTKAEGIAAKKLAEAKEAQDKLDKERYDEQNKNELADAAAVSQLLLNARASRGYLPAAGPATSKSNRACFDRARLESAMGRLDEGGSGIARKGNDFRLSLEIDKRWAQGR